MSEVPEGISKFGSELLEPGAWMLEQLAIRIRSTVAKAQMDLGFFFIFSFTCTETELVHSSLLFLPANSRLFYYMRPGEAISRPRTFVSVDKNNTMR